MYLRGDWQLEVQFGLDPQWFTEKFETSIKPCFGFDPGGAGLADRCGYPTGKRP
jgi:hypothetical protein